MGYAVTTRDRALGTSSWILKHKPWLVVLDLEMPALSGEELADFLKTKGLDTPVIIHSGKSEEELKQVVRSTGALGAIRKGLSDAQFGIQFNNLVKAARTRKSLPARRSTSATRRSDIGGADPPKRTSTDARRLGDPE
jgi:FixJ family two-component response regulator